MTGVCSVILAVLAGSACWSQASVLQVLPQRGTVDVFSGAQAAEVLFRNSDAEPRTERLSFRLYQLSSATAMPIAGWAAYKPITVLPGQTVLEHIEFTIPAVRARTTFEIRWASAAGTSIGATVITAYPSNLLGQLSSLSDAIGICDPQDRIKPLLARSGVAAVDVPRSGVEGFNGPLLIVALFDQKAGDRVLEEKLLSSAGRGTRVVFITADPSFSAGTDLVIHGAKGGRIAFVNARNFATIGQDPRAQLLLLDLVRLVTKTNLHALEAKL